MKVELRVSSPAIEYLLALAPSRKGGEDSTEIVWRNAVSGTKIWGVGPQESDEPCKFVKFPTFLSLPRPSGRVWMKQPTASSG